MIAQLQRVNWKQGNKVVGLPVDVRNGAGHISTQKERKDATLVASSGVPCPAKALPKALNNAILKRKYSKLDTYLGTVVGWFKGVYPNRCMGKNLTIHTFNVPIGTNYEELSDYCQAFFKKNGFHTMRINNERIHLIGILVKKRS